MKRVFLYFVTASLLCCHYACNKENVPATDNVHVKFDERTYNEQKQLWQASNTKDYEYHLFASGFLMYDGIISVEDGNFKNEELLHEYSVSSVDLGYSTIDMIYERIEEIFKFYNGTKKSDLYCKEISVEYDKINHIPIKINYIYYVSPGLAVDGTFDYTISNFNKRTESPESTPQSHQNAASHAVRLNYPACTLRL